MLYVVTVLACVVCCDVTVVHWMLLRYCHVLYVVMVLSYVLCCDSTEMCSVLSQYCHMLYAVTVVCHLPHSLSVLPCVLCTVCCRYWQHCCVLSVLQT